jgi:hypothetical protein
LKRAQRLQPLLALTALLVPLLVNHAREGVLPVARNGVRNGDNARKQQPRGLAEPQGRGEEAQRGAVVHGRGRDVEGEARHGRVHQDAKVVAQVRARDAQRPHARQHERVARQEERDRRVLDQRVEERRVRGLRGESLVVAVRERVSGVERKGEWSVGVRGRVGRRTGSL